MPNINFSIRDLCEIYAATTNEDIRRAIVYAIDAETMKNGEYIPVPAWESRLVSCSSYGNNKIAVIKAVRGFTSIGLREAKDFVEGVGDSRLLKVYDPENFKRDVEREGAKIVIHPVSRY